MKLLRQVTLTEFHKHLRQAHPTEGKYYIDNHFWENWYRSRINRYKIYQGWLNYLKNKQQQELEQELWREIHGD